MKKILYFIVVFAAVVAAFALTACGKKDSSTTGSSTDIVAEIPYVSDFACDYYAGEGFANRVKRSTAFGSEDEVLIKLSFTLSSEAFKDGKRRLTIKPILSEGFYGSIVSANTSSVNNTDLTAAYDVDDRKSKNCEIEFKTKFDHSSGELQIGYSYDGEEYQATGSYALLCSQPFMFTYDAATDGYVVSRDSYNYDWILDAERVEIPDTFGGKPITAIGEAAFSYCENLVNIVIPDTVINIGMDAFFYCRSLTGITIPDGVTSIGYNAFTYCSSLTSITIPAGLTIVKGNAFNVCDNLKTVNITDLAAWCNIDFGGESATPMVNAAELRLNGELLQNLVIPDGIAKIKDYSFYGCNSLISVTIPDSVTSIGDCAFLGCSGLTNITIPDSVTSIGNYAFLDCSSLTSITMPGIVTNIGYYAFSGCSKLTSITVTFDGTKEQWLSIAANVGEEGDYGNVTIECMDGKIKFWFKGM